MTNHRQNILNIMRFYNRIGKEFNAPVYIQFVTPADGAHAKGRNVPTLSKTYEYIRRYISNGWCTRDGENILITPKGLKVLEEWEKKKYLKEANVSDETLRRRRLEQD